MRTTPTGLADLARACRTLNPTAADCLAIAHLVGLDGAIMLAEAAASPAAAAAAATAGVPAPETSRPRAVHDPAIPSNGSGDVRPAMRTSRASFMEAERVRHRPAGPRRNPVGLPIKLTEVKPPASGEMPQFIADAEELDFEVDTIRRLPLPEPLVPAAQLRSLITDLIAAPIPGDPDIEKLIRDIARGHVPRVLPRKQRKGAARRIHVVVDTADSMRLFQRDAAVLLAKLRKVAGDAIQSEVGTSGPPVDSHAHFARGDTLLILSDLGIGSRRARRARIAAWRDYATRLYTRGLRVVGLVPFHYTRWPGALKHWIRLVHWHRPGSVARPATPEQLRRMARVLSLAAVIDPALLRLARMTLLPGADAGAEADFARARWTSFFNPRVVGLMSAWMVGLRAELALDPELLELARRLLVGQRPKSADWTRVVYEEQTVFLALQATEESSRELERALARVIRSLLGRLRDDVSSARWALYFIEELPEAARNSKAAQLLKAVASRMLSTSFDEVHRIVTEYDAKWVFDRSTEVGVLWDGAHLIVRDPPHVGDRIMLVPDTHPRVVIVQNDEERKHILRITRGFLGWTAARLPRRLTSVAGAEYEVESHPGGWEVLQRVFKSNDAISTVVSGVIPGRGYRVDIGLEALLPEREILLAYRGRTDFIGTRVSVRIVSMDEKWREITVGLVEGAADPSEEVWRELAASFRAFTPIRGIITVAGVTACVVEILGAPFVVPYFELQRGERGQRACGELCGKELEFCIAAMDETLRQVTLTRNFRMFESWKTLIETKLNGGSLRGKLQELVRGGYRVDIGFPMFPAAFIPMPLMGMILDNFEDHVGREYEFRIEVLNWSDNFNVILTRKEAARPGEVERLTQGSTIRVGQVHRGIVHKVGDYGVIVAIENVLGLVSSHELIAPAGANPRTLFRRGDPIEVKVIRIDRARGRVSLSQKALLSEEVFVRVAERHPVGSRFLGRVTALERDRAYVEIEEGIEGVLTAAHYARLSVGNEVDVQVMAINRRKRTILLSLKFGEHDPWEKMTEQHPVGSLVALRVIEVRKNDSLRLVSDDGLIGLMRRKEIPLPPEGTLSDFFMRSQMVVARILDISSEKRHVWFTMKDVPAEEWTAFAESHPVGTEVVGIVSRRTPLAIFLALAPGVEGILQKENGGLVVSLDRAERLRVRIARIDFQVKRIDLTAP